MPPFSSGSFVPNNNFPSKYPTANGLSSLNQAMQVTDTNMIKQDKNFKKKIRETYLSLSPLKDRDFATNIYLYNHCK